MVQNIEELKIRLSQFQAIDDVVLQDGQTNANEEENETVAADSLQRETVSEGGSSNPSHTETESEVTSLQEDDSSKQTEVSSTEAERNSEEKEGNIKQEDDVNSQTSASVNEPLSHTEGQNSMDAKDPSLPLGLDPDSTPNDHSTDRTGTMSPNSFATFKGFLVHTPEMNLPWESMRSVRQCTCGVTFSFSIRKVNQCDGFSLFHPVC